jgi:glycosyltransferase involved in cell wall biosynthesis
MPPVVSVILPTFRRPKLLQAALESLARSENSVREHYEVIIVDNNSGDSTPDVVARMAPTFPFPLRYVLEQVQGVSVARNRGASEANGALLVFMDEDQQIDPGYLARVPETATETGADCFGGWLGYVDIEKFPAWLWTVVGRVGQRDYGPHGRPLKTNERLAGGNMIFPRAVFERYGGFRTDVGPNGKNTTYGEDIDIQDRIQAAGGKLFYDPALRQNHYLEPERMKRSYYLNRAFQAGRGEFRLQRPGFARARSVFGIPLFLLRRTGVGMLAVAGSALARPEARFNAWCRLAADMGQCQEAFSHRNNLGDGALNPTL